MPDSSSQPSPQSSTPPWELHLPHEPSPLDQLTLLDVALDIHQMARAGDYASAVARANDALSVIACRLHGELGDMVIADLVRITRCPVDDISLLSAQLYRHLEASLQQHTAPAA